MNFRISNDIRTFSLEVGGNIGKRPSFGFSAGATGRVIGVIDGGSYTEYRHGIKGKGCVNSPKRPEQASMRDSRNMASPVISGLYCKSAPQLMLPSYDVRLLELTVPPFFLSVSQTLSRPGFVCIAHSRSEVVIRSPRVIRKRAPTFPDVTHPRL